MLNDPRPHFFHQTNLAESERPEGAVFYPVLNATLASYSRYFNASEPIVQLTPTQISEQLNRQERWGSASGVSGYIEGARVVVANAGTAVVSVPLSGTEVGTLYGGTRSGWANAAVGSSTHTAAAAWPAPAPAAAPTAGALLSPSGF